MIFLLLWNAVCWKCRKSIFKATNDSPGALWNPNSPISHGVLSRFYRIFKNRGISNELAQTVLNELSDQDIWLKKAVECLARIQKNTKIQTQASLSQKLYQRGFAWETIEQALEEYQNLAELADTGKFNSASVVLTTKNH